VFNALEQMVVTLTFPDLTFILDVPAEVGLGPGGDAALAQALSGDAPDAFEKRDVEFHERLREGYLAIAKAEPHRCHVIDGTREPDAILPRSGPKWSAACWRAALMARAPAVQDSEALPEGRSLDDFPHPRETRALFGHEAS
jgi:dTMP kinase